MKQKTLYHHDVEELDKMVNEFEETNRVVATQSYWAMGNHYRVLFISVVVDGGKK